MSLDPNRTLWGDSAATRYQVRSILVNSRYELCFSPIMAMGFQDSQRPILQYYLGQVCSTQYLLTAKLAANHRNRSSLTLAQHTTIKLSAIEIKRRIKEKERRWDTLISVAFFIPKNTATYAPDAMDLKNKK